MSAYSTAVLATSGLVNYWRLNEISGTTAADSKGVNTGTYAGTYSQGTGSLIGANSDDPSLQLPGGHRIGRVTAAANTITWTGSFTIECWIRPLVNVTDFPPAYVVVGDQTAPASGAVIFLCSNGGGGVRFNSWNGTGTDTPWILQPGSIYHIVATCNAATKAFQIFVNGVSKSSFTSNVAPNPNTADPLTIGDWGPLMGAAQPTWNTTQNGAVSHVALYSNIMVASDIANHYALGINAIGMNNFQFVKVGDGMSVTEKIR